ncbi:MAG: diphosphate--fructose-6-phosphate 1-phosphotransferase [Planctomycetes bacterium]|nr:diphosphate--fructose-6-phosphate 1-phosphotransferase [Planctomycetota bacterium]
MSDILKGNAVIGQSGGPTAVINQSMVGCVEGLKAAGFSGKILGAHHAVRGMLNEDFIPLHTIPQDRLNRIADTPSAGLGSSRDKPDAEHCKNVLKALAKHDIRYFFYIGGNDSSDTCRLVNEAAKADGYEMRAFHIPKTIDNDLQCNDHTPGFGSAANFVASAFIGDNLDNRALPGIKINIIMGRHAGFLTAASVLARQNPEDGPHLIYCPESAFDEEKFVADVDRVFKKHGRCLIAVSEGISDAKHTPIAAKLAEQQGAAIDRDSHGNVQLSGSGALGDFLATHLKNHLGKKLRVRADTFGYVQRCFAGSISKVDQIEARAVGRKAAEVALAGQLDEGSITINRTSDNPYTVEYGVTAVTNIAAKTRHMKDEWIIDGNNVADDFVRYVRPLVGTLPTVELIRMPGRND